MIMVYWFYSQEILWIHPLFSVSNITLLVQLIVISYLDYCNNISIGLQLSTLDLLPFFILKAGQSSNIKTHHSLLLLKTLGKPLTALEVSPESLTCPPSHGNTISASFLNLISSHSPFPFLKMFPPYQPFSCSKAIWVFLWVAAGGEGGYRAFTWARQTCPATCSLDPAFLHISYHSSNTYLCIFLTVRSIRARTASVLLDDMTT